MRGMSRAHAGIALAAVAMVLSGCGAQGGDPAASADGTAASPGVGAPSTGGDGGTGTDARSGGGSRVSTHDAVAKPPKGAYDDTSGTKLGSPHGQQQVLAHLPGTSKTSCVSVGSRSVVRSGPIGMGSFSQARKVFAAAKTPYNAEPSFFYVIPRQRGAASATVVATHAGRPPVTVHVRHLESAAQWHYFPVHLQIPARGSWRFSVTVGADRGCFVATFS
jgi:hypothetical protein